jgi:dihydrodipicolinate synthase/N-acetylneuraminate lyase
MSKFEPGEAREWALSSLRGVCGCVMPSFTADLGDLNEAAIRHDVQRERELGFTGFLIVNECGTSEPEWRRFVEICVDEAGDDLVTVVQAASDTLAHNQAIAEHASAAGVDLMMPSYPLGFYPEDGDEIVAYTRALAEAGAMGVVVFAMNLWNFERLHPSGFKLEWLEQIVEKTPQVVAIKNEVGEPGVGGIAEVFRRFTGQVIVSDPLEMNSPAWTSTHGMQWMGTSNYEYFGASVPDYFALLQDRDRFEDAMDIYWRIHPSRQATGALMKQANAGTTLVHRLLWKYQGWLQGFNGGPVRSPHMRLSDEQMGRLRSAAVASRLDVTDEPDAMFFQGRVRA